MWTHRQQFETCGLKKQRKTQGWIIRRALSLAIFFLTMVDLSMAFLSSSSSRTSDRNLPNNKLLVLVPSQALRKTSPRTKADSKLNPGKKHCTDGNLVPSQVLFSHPSALNTPEEVSSQTENSSSIPETSHPNNEMTSLSNPESPSPHSTMRNKRRNRRTVQGTQPKLHGNLPDIEW